MIIKIEIRAEGLGPRDVVVYENAVECTMKQLQRLINGISIAVGHALENNRKDEAEEDM